MNAKARVQRLPYPVMGVIYFESATLNIKEAARLAHFSQICRTTRQSINLGTVGQELSQFEAWYIVTKTINRPN